MARAERTFGRPPGTSLLAAAGAAGVLGAAAGWRRLTAADAEAVDRDPVAPLLAPLDRPQRRTTVTSADGTKLHVRTVGPDDAPTVVLAHGWTCSTDYWTPQLRTLCDEARLVTYDQRGHGRSEAGPGHAFSADHLADDLEAVLDATVADGGRAVLVGHSMGAMSILAWAHRHADSVRDRAAAALLASTGVTDLVTESLLVRLPSGWRRARSLVGRAFLTAPGALGRANPITHRGVRYTALSPSASPAQVAFCEQIILGCPPRVRSGWGGVLHSLDLRHAVASLTVPTTVVVGDADRLTPPVHARRLAAALPRLERLVELPGVGHMSTVEAAPIVDDQIRRLVSAHVAPVGRVTPGSPSARPPSAVPSTSS
jgi:pimeloyl-ACP methyl ester carboxylesterase